MTRKILKINILVVTLIYGTFILIGTCIFFIQPDGENKYFNVFKELILLWVAIPAAYLGDCFQRRSAFTSALREMWANLIDSVNQARQYTFDPEPTQKSYGEVLKSLSKSIDEVRGVYCNIGESRFEIGIYPFESLKEIQRIVSQLGFNKFEKTKADKARCSIEFHWGLIKKSFLFEFDRPKPSMLNSPYIKTGKYNNWEIANCIELKTDDGKTFFKHKSV